MKKKFKIIDASSGEKLKLGEGQMSLFEDWYITYYSDCIDVEDDLVKDENGVYLDIRTFLMHKAFLAGQVLWKGEE